MCFEGIDRNERIRPLIRFTARVCALAVLLCISARVSCAQDDFSQREAKIKAVFLFKFISYVKWPEEAFVDEKTPFVIGTLGKDPVNSYVKLISENRDAGERALKYSEISDPSEASDCHILFISESVNPQQVSAVLANVQDAPVMLVGERPGFAKTHGGIGFVIIDNNVRLEISLKDAEKRGLKVSSQLAKLARVID